MDVGVFSSYAHYYKKELSKRCRFAAHYSVDKVTFLEILQDARAQALTEKTILKAWKKSGLFPSNPEVVLQKLLPQPSMPISNQTPSLTFIASNGEAFQAALTPRNVTEVGDLVKRVLEDETLNPVIALRIKKLQKVAVKAITDTTIQSSINEELLMQLKKHKKREA